MVRKCIWVLVILGLPFSWIGGMSAQEKDNWRLVLRLPDTVKVEIRPVIFKSVDNTRLRMDVYYPPGFNPERSGSLPAVILHNASFMEIVDMEGYRDWGKALAVSGIIAIGHQSRPFEREDTDDLIFYIRSHSGELGIDAERLGFWTASGNTLIGYPFAMDKGRDDFRCVVFYYGMPDPDVVVKHEPLRQDLPLFIVRCGLDEFRASRNIDFFIVEALKADMDLEFVNYLQGHHAFDIVDDNDRSREIIRRTLAFFKRHLMAARDRGPGHVFASMSFYCLLREGRIEEAGSQFQAKLAEMKADQSRNPFYHREIWERSLILTGQELLRKGKKIEAREVFRWALEAHPESPTAHLSAADGFHSCGDISKAIETVQRAIELSLNDPNLSEDQIKAFRESVEQRLKRWGLEKDNL